MFSWKSNNTYIFICFFSENAPSRASFWIENTFIHRGEEFNIDDHETFKSAKAVLIFKGFFC